MEHQFSLRAAFFALTLVAVAIPVSRFVPHLAIFVAAFVFAVATGEYAIRHRKSTDLRAVSFFLAAFACVVLYVSSVGPVILTSRFVEHGLPRPNVFASVSLVLERFYLPVVVIGENWLRAPLYWYCEAWLLRRGNSADPPDPTYVLFCIMAPWTLVAVILGYVAWVRRSKWG